MDESFTNFHVLYETVIDDEVGDDMKRFFAFLKHAFLFLLMKTVPTPSRISGYAENIIPLFATAHFKFHFRISKEMYEVILQQVGGELLPSHGGGSDETDPSKQVLLFLWYLANQQSFREISQIFNVSMSTVHATLKRVNTAINKKLWNVSKCTHILHKVSCSIYKFQSSYLYYIMYIWTDVGTSQHYFSATKTILDRQRCYRLF
jgi:hypothetical protein